MGMLELLGNKGLEIQSWGAIAIFVLGSVLIIVAFDKVIINAGKKWLNNITTPGTSLASFGATRIIPVDDPNVDAVDRVARYFLAGRYSYYQNEIAAKKIVKAGYRFSTEEIPELKRSNSHSKDGTPAPMATPNEDVVTLAHVLATNGYKFTQAELLELGNPREPNGITVAHIMAAKGHIFSVEELNQLGDIQQNPYTIAHAMAMTGYFFSFADLMKIGNPRTEWGSTVAHMMAGNGHQFSFDELIEMGNPVENNGISVGHIMAQKGHVFTYSEVAQLGNLPNRYGITIANAMASCGSFFRFEEVMELGNPRDNQGITLAHMMAAAGFKFTVDQLLQLKNPMDYSGRSVAQYMARTGHKFSFDEIQQLGNQKDNFGLSIATEMILNGHEFSPSEIKALGMEINKFPFSDYVTYEIGPHFSSEPKHPTHCPMCRNSLKSQAQNPSTFADNDRAKYATLMPFHNYTILFTCDQCHFWFIRENWTFYEVGNGTCDYLVVGVIADQVKPGVDVKNVQLEPWFKALADPHLYDHALNLPYELIAMFPDGRVGTT